MKKISFLLFLCVSCMTMHAYTPLLKSGHTRTDCGMVASMGDNTLRYATTKYQISGDTTISGAEYCYCGEYLLREDTENRKVYIFLPDSAKEFLLYDFSAVVGDSVYVFSRYEYKNYPIVITAIDTIVDLASNNVRRFTYDTYPYGTYEPRTYAEGYGAIDMGLIYYNEVPQLAGGMRTTLRCWLDNEDSKLMFNDRGSEYLGDDCEGSGVISAVDDIRQNNIAVVYTQGTLFFSQEVTGISVISSDGRILSSRNDGATDSFSIKLPAGVYFIKFTADGKESLNRIVVF